MGSCRDIANLTKGWPRIVATKAGLMTRDKFERRTELQNVITDSRYEPHLNRRDLTAAPLTAYIVRFSERIVFCYLKFYAVYV